MAVFFLILGTLLLCTGKLLCRYTNKKAARDPTFDPRKWHLATVMVYASSIMFNSLAIGLLWGSKVAN